MCGEVGGWGGLLTCCGETVVYLGCCMTRFVFSIFVNLLICDGRWTVFRAM